jgi:hypothetical protein
MDAERSLPLSLSEHVPAIGAPALTPQRRFPPPWVLEENRLLVI